MSNLKDKPVIVLLKSAQIAEDSGPDKYTTLLKQDNLETVSVCTLHFEFNRKELTEAVKHPDNYSGFIFTSPRSVESVSRALNGESLLPSWKEKNHYCVGDKTKHTSESLLDLRNVRGAEAGSAELLAPYIVNEIKPGSLPLLFPCSNIRQDTLPCILSHNDISLEAVTAYFTAPHPNLESSIESLCNTVPKILVFFSPSGISYAKPHLEKYGILHDVNKVVCIGSTTAKAAQDSNIAVAKVCAKPTPEHLLEAIKSLL